MPTAHTRHILASLVASGEHGSARHIVDLTALEDERTLKGMRYSLEHKARNHEKILSVAARSFRERGGDSSGIGLVMKKVGLKKGGFYRHFKSKDDLFVEAVARALDSRGNRQPYGKESRYCSKRIVSGSCHSCPVRPETRNGRRSDCYSPAWQEC